MKDKKKTFGYADMGKRDLSQFTFLEYLAQKSATPDVDRYLESIYTNWSHSKKVEQGDIQRIGFNCIIDSEEKIKFYS